MLLVIVKTPKRGGTEMSVHILIAREVVNKQRAAAEALPTVVFEWRSCHAEILVTGAHVADPCKKISTTRPHQKKLMVPICTHVA